MFRNVCDKYIVKAEKKLGILKPAPKTMEGLQKEAASLGLFEAEPKIDTQR